MTRAHCIIEADWQCLDQGKSFTICNNHAITLSKNHAISKSCHSTDPRLFGYETQTDLPIIVFQSLPHGNPSISDNLTDRDPYM